jgi:serine/threonine protein kinase
MSPAQSYIVFVYITDNKKYFELSSSVSCLTMACVVETLKQRRERLLDEGLVELRRTPGLEVDMILGKGGFARVYKIYDRELGKHAAVKMQPKTRSSAKELKFLTELKPHKSVASMIREIELSRDLHAFVIEYVPMNLQGQLAMSKSAPGPIQMKTVMSGLVSAVCHLFNSEIFHNDIKPSNILVREWVPKLCDFNSATRFNRRLVYTKNG